MNNKEVLKKLYKIAQNQQKIIRKLAQASEGIQLNAGVLQNLADRFLGKGNAQVQYASLTSENGVVTVGLTVANQEEYDTHAAMFERALTTPNVLVSADGARHSASQASVNA